MSKHFRLLLLFTGSRHTIIKRRRGTSWIAAIPSPDLKKTDITTATARLNNSKRHGWSSWLTWSGKSQQVTATMIVRVHVEELK